MPIEKVSPNLDRIASSDQDIEQLGEGYRLAEGPVWYHEGDYLLFSDIPGNRRYKWSPREGVTLFLEPTDEGNGLTRDRQGRLVACEHKARRMTRLEDDGTITVLADRYQGKPLNNTNDVVVKSDGTIYFTDPVELSTNLDLDFSGVYRISPDLSTLTLLERDMLNPNGLALSPDEKVLYVDDSRNWELRAFDVQPDGTVTKNRVFFDFKQKAPIFVDMMKAVGTTRTGNPDGMKVDVEGNIYCTGPGGVWIIDPSGEHLGTILTGANRATNCAWGDNDWKTLYITTFTTLARIRLKVPGIPVP